MQLIADKFKKGKEEKGGKDKQAGLTLISLLVASSILVVFSLYVAFILFDLAQFDLRSQAKQTALENTSFAMDRIKQDVRSATAIDSPAVNEVQDSFTLQTPDGQVDYYLSDQVLIREDGTSGVPVISDLAKVKNFEVSTIKSNDQAKSLKVSLNLEWTGELIEGQSDSFELNSTVSLRK